MQTHDLDAVAAIEAEVQDFPWSREHFADSLAEGHEAWVLRQGGLIIGFTIFMQTLDEAHLLNIGVLPAFQGQGMGAGLLRHVMEHSIRQGAKYLFLEVRISNTRAQALYRHFGFREVGQRKAYYPGVSIREDALVFSRILEG